MNSTAWIIIFSIRVYYRLMRLYPASHRAELGAEELQVFRTQLNETYRRRGAFGVVRVWLRSGPDLVRSAVDARLVALVTPNSTDPPMTRRTIITLGVIEVLTLILIAPMVWFPGSAFDPASEDATILPTVLLLIVVVGQLYCMRWWPRVNRWALKAEKED